MAYDRIQPIGPERYDYLNALSCYLFATANSKSGANIKVDDFMPGWGEGASKQSAADIEAALTSFANLHNKKVTK